MFKYLSTFRLPIVHKYSIFLGECFHDDDCSSTPFPMCNTVGYCGKFSSKNFEIQCNLILLPISEKIPISKNLFFQTNTAHCLDHSFVCDYYKNCLGTKDLLCDGEDNCYYGEDEKDCGKNNHLKIHILIVLRDNVHTQYINLDVKY